MRRGTGDRDGWVCLGLNGAWGVADRALRRLPTRPLAGGRHPQTATCQPIDPTVNCQPQDLLDDGSNLGTDASGNPILKDIGMYLKVQAAGGGGTVEITLPPFPIDYCWASLLFWGLWIVKLLLWLENLSV